MPYSREFPFLAEVTKDLDPVMLAHVGRNIDTFGIAVRIDYERWIQYCKEYEQWIDVTTDNEFNLGEQSKKETKNEI